MSEPSAVPLTDVLQKGYEYTLRHLLPLKGSQRHLEHGVEGITISLPEGTFNSRKFSVTGPSAFSPEDYERKYPAREMDAAHYSPLTARPTSPEALSACRELAELLLPQTGAKVTNIRLKALGALVADLLERDPDDEGGWLFRSMDPKYFTGQEVGYKPFHTVYLAMVLEVVEERLGFQSWGPSAITASGVRPMRREATRYRATPALREWFEVRGVSRESWGDHFMRVTSPIAAPRNSLPVVLRPGKAHQGAMRGYNIPIDRKDPNVAALAERMDRINAFLERFAVEPFGPVVLRRIFAQGDDPAHGWRQGGRLYAIGDSPYQTVKKAKRREITIDGHPTCELDIQASHLTILAGLGYIPRFTGDPYDIEGLPRPVVKRWVNMTLSHGRRHARWPSQAVADMQKDHGIDLAADYPIGPTGDAILKHLPILKDEGSSAVAIGWGELQFRESEAVLAAMETLAFEHGVPALPVHDSLIVPIGWKAVAVRSMESAFRTAVGISPVIG